MSDAIFVVGYYRSGTSALSGALQRAGVKFYNDADPNEHNPLGFYEIPELIQLDVDLFSQIGVEWTDVRGLPPGWQDRADLAPLRTRLDEILRRRFPPRERLWGLKHPHLCRTLPLYERIASQAGHKPHVVHIFRDPWVAAASQARKNGLSRAHALLLWLNYATDAERNARHLPRCWTTYHQLLANPAGELHAIAARLKLARELRGDGFKQASAYLTSQLNRAEPLVEEGLSPTLRDLVHRAWAAIKARDFASALWDGLAAETADLAGFLAEIAASRAPAVPGFGNALIPAATAGAPAPLRPPERTDAAARARLEALRDQSSPLPSLAVLIAAPAGRAHAVHETLESLRGQWLPPAIIQVLAADKLALPDTPVQAVASTPEAMTRRLCQNLNILAETHDYVAIINAGDRIDPDGCLRFALLAAQSRADMIYSDEIVPREGGAWVRHKPGWDVTRLRQAAYLGDWVWYKGAALRAAGGFDPALAGAEEYDLQLRLAERGARVERLPEAVFLRGGQSLRDEIAPPLFCARAAAALSRHLAAASCPAEVQNRQYPGLFQHLRVAADPGTAIIMLCDGAELPRLNAWMSGLLGGKPLSGPVILAGAELSAPVRDYLAAIAAQRDTLGGHVLAHIAASPAAALAGALALAATEHVAILDARMLDITPHWLEGLRQRLADPQVAAVAARGLIQGPDGQAGQIIGPIVIGADGRLGAGRGPLDAGPGGWLLVDQEASAIAPPGLLARRAALAACLPAGGLRGDALWIDLCAQLRAAGARLVWTPDVSVTLPAEAAPRADAEGGFRAGSPAAAALPWEDPYHHPALSLRGDVLAAEARTGLVRACPADPLSLLVTGEAAQADTALNAARALRAAGMMEADWAPDLPSAAELGRRAPHPWVRLNPLRAAQPGSPPYAAIVATPPPAEAQPALAGAAQLYATSPALAVALTARFPAQPPARLWRPALSRPLWQGFKPGEGLNTKPRILWVDEGIAPLWLPELIRETLDAAAWIIVERAGGDYPGGAARLAPPGSEQGWAQALAPLGPQILLRPAAAAVWPDHYPALLAAAAGCHLLVDERLDLPSSLEAKRLGQSKAEWGEALRGAIADLPETLRRGARSRAAALALPSLEEAPPDWAFPQPPALASAAE